MQQIIESHEKLPSKNRKPWCTPTLSKKIKQQHKLHQEKIKNPTPENIKLHAQYRNKLNKEIKQKKKQFITKQLEDAKTNPKKTAKILKSLIPSKNNTRSSPTTLIYKDKELKDPQDIANALNNHYITIGEKTAKKIPHYENDDSITNTPPTNHPPFKLKLITPKEVLDTLEKIDPTKASDIYKIKPAIIKDLAPFITSLLTQLFNEAIKEHKYPDALKFTKVIEIYKSKDKKLPVNYRPISSL